MMKPKTTTGPWDDHAWKLWDENVAPLFTKPESEEWCSNAHYYVPRPYRNEYDRGSDKEGFTYIVMPDHRVCTWSRSVK